MNTVTMSIGDIFIENFIVLLVSAVVIGTLSFVKNHFAQSTKKYFIIAYVTLVIYSLCSSVDKYLSQLTYRTVWRYIAAFISNGFRPSLAILAIFIIYKVDFKGKMIFSIPQFINFLFYTTIFYSPLVMTFNEDNEFKRGPLGYLSIGITAFYGILLVVTILYLYFKEKKRNQSIILAVIVCVCAGAGFLDVKYSQCFLNNTLAVAYLCYFLFLCINASSDYEEQMAENQKNELMLSQIQPHFMYNVLNSIYYLCDHDPKKAKFAVNTFSNYLRNNLDAIRGDKIVSFKDELNFCKNYLELEKIRFDEELQVVFNIETMDFYLPKFTVQPLSENAVKHGVSQKEGGGTVEIYTKDLGDKVEVGVRDDGVGFVVGTVPDDGRSHTGMENVGARIHDYTGEEMHIESTPGVGTHIWFYIKK